MWPFDRSSKDAAPARPQRVQLSRRPAVIYAVGDVHGCLDDLARLQSRIVQDAARSSGEKLIIMLGDYIDRGPRSAQTLDFLMGAAPAGMQRICLRGNHEAAFLQVLQRPGRSDDWLSWGGGETLQSYGIDAIAFARASSRLRGQMLHSSVPEEHRQFMHDLPLMVTIDNLAFVHAGIRPGLPLAAQEDEDLLWIREPFLGTAHKLGIRVFHGHTPALEPVVLPYRVCVDTLAYGGGTLTAARIDAQGGLTFLQSTP
mgnify:CR=1 FL=1|tara:strand:+ start:368 stop:1138 length:771 start_codon:yes stop_codon:yes gene_type:complete